MGIQRNTVWTIEFVPWFSIEVSIGSAIYGENLIVLGKVSLYKFQCSANLFFMLFNITMTTTAQFHTQHSEGECEDTIEPPRVVITAFYDSSIIFKNNNYAILK